MTITDQDWREEQERVNAVTAQIAGRIGNLEEEAGEVKVDVVDIRKHFWDEVTVNFIDPADAAETAASLKQQAEVLSDRERSHRNAAAALDKMRRLVRTPYFGRIDFAVNGEAAEPIYLGIASFLDDKEESFLIYDWRAPISSLYYDYPPGPAEFETPGGSVEGEMTLKRQFVIRDADIRLMFDTGVTIGDEMLQQVLSRSSDAQMKSIVATIQKEQNRLIRNDRSRMLVVQGAAGSGKTSSALQRVAYLLYKHRETLQADQMVLFSPNPLFNSYVMTVLPELGEENMQQTTFHEYLERRLGREFQLEDPFSQMEYMLTASEEPGYKEKAAGIRYKSSADFLRVLKRYKEVLEQEGMKFKGIKFMGSVIVSAEQVRQRFYELDPGMGMVNRLLQLRDWLLKEIDTYAHTQKDQDWVEEAAQLLDAEDYHRVYNRLRRKQAGHGVTFDDFDMQKRLLADIIVGEKMKPLRKRIKRLRFVDVTKVYRQLFADERMFALASGESGVTEYWGEVCRQTVGRLEKFELAYEDAAPYLYLKEMVLGFDSNNAVRHIFIDEAQDYSPFQFEFLKRLFPRARMTALGDLNQAIFPHATALGEFGPLEELYGREETEWIRLTQSYRSTREIVEFTRGMVPGGEEIQPFNRSGGIPKVVQGGDASDLSGRMAADIAWLQTEGYDSIAVICKTAAESAKAFEILQGLLRVHLITKFSPSFEKGVLVIPAYLAKGVEFDAVFIWDGSKRTYRRENERKLFYTACTRAMHTLTIYSQGEPSPFITDQPKESYTLENV